MEISNLLPKFLDATKLARKNSIIEGSLLFSSLDLLSEYQSCENAKLTGTFKFHLGKNGRVFVDGTINVGLQLICQRCMQPMLHPISSEFTLVCIDNQDQEKQLAVEGYESVLLNNGKLEVPNLIQEEVLLAIPIVAYHKTEDCTGHQSYSCADKLVSTDQNHPKSSNSNNPFAILKNLKSN